MIGIKKKEIVMKNNSISSEERAMYPELDMLEGEKEYYKEEMQSGLWDEFDPLEYLKGKDSSDYGTVLEYYRDKRKRKRRKAEKRAQRLKKVSYLWSTLLKLISIK